MPYDTALWERVHEIIADDPSTTHKKMFGGICVLVNGNMAAGVMLDFLMLRTTPERRAALMTRAHTHEKVGNMRSMKSIFYVGGDGLIEEADLSGWLNEGLDFAKALPPKT